MFYHLLVASCAMSFCHLLVASCVMSFCHLFATFRLVYHLLVAFRLSILPSAPGCIPSCMTSFFHSLVVLSAVFRLVWCRSLLYSVCCIPCVVMSGEGSHLCHVSIYTSCDLYHGSTCTFFCDLYHRSTYTFFQDRIYANCKRALQHGCNSIITVTNLSIYLPTYLSTSLSTYPSPLHKMSLSFFLLYANTHTTAPCTVYNLFK